MLRDPAALLAKASTILGGLGPGKDDKRFEQIHMEPGTYEEEEVGIFSLFFAGIFMFSMIFPLKNSVFVLRERKCVPFQEEKPLPEFHGEPVPSDDDEALFLEAAGLKKVR